VWTLRKDDSRTNAAFRTVSRTERLRIIHALKDSILNSFLLHQNSKNRCRNQKQRTVSPLYAAKGHPPTPQLTLLVISTSWSFNLRLGVPIHRCPCIQTCFASSAAESHSHQNAQRTRDTRRDDRRFQKSDLRMVVCGLNVACACVHLQLTRKTAAFGR
jgi:hypothetical protein